jgi:hypothetical protein
MDVNEHERLFQHKLKERNNTLIAVLHFTMGTVILQILLSLCPTSHDEVTNTEKKQPQGSHQVNRKKTTRFDIVWSAHWIINWRKGTTPWLLFYISQSHISIHVETIMVQLNWETHLETYNKCNLKKKIYLSFIPFEMRIMLNCCIYVYIRI